MIRYHSTNNELTWLEAMQVHIKNQEAVQQAGGTLTAPSSWVRPPAILVLELPPNIDPDALLPGIGFRVVLLVGENE